MMIKKTGPLHKLLFTVRGWNLKAKYTIINYINLFYYYLSVWM
jgi:hypothetical protein